MKCRTRSEQQAKQPWCQTSESKRLQRLLVAEEREISCALLLPAFHPAFAATAGGTGACASTSPTQKWHLLPTFNCSKNRHPHPLGLFQPHPPPLFLYERWKIGLLNCSEIDCQKKNLATDIFKPRYLYVCQRRACEIFHHLIQIFLISYLWILYSQIPFLS